MLTVLMATYNGAATLPRVLEAYTRLHKPSDGYRLVVADNASTDDTPAILAAFAPRLPLQALRIERRGKNVALNAALGHIEGDLVVLTDDDAVPDPDWLVQIQRSAHEQTSYDMFAGLIEPIWPGPCPSWILQTVNLGATFGLTPSHLLDGPVPASQVWGANMAVRAQIFHDGHRFNDQIGPAAGQYIMGSEVEFTSRIEALGHKAWYSSSARVGHMIRANQMEPQWIIQRGYRLGRHMCQKERSQWWGQVPLFRGAPRWMYGKLLREAGRACMARVGGSFERRFSADWEISFLRGYLDEAIRLRHAAAAR